ncbi:MAG TPA: hypothetical protein VFD60_11195 [Nitrososphaeraceae archaeon]|nr:hypothetical protein [Nitrososphaeraceae archaeon]
MSCFSDNNMSITMLSKIHSQQWKYNKMKNDDDECSLEIWYQMSFVTDIDNFKLKTEARPSYL